MTYRIKYFVYNSDEFGDTAFAETEEEANRIADGLRKLKHVTKVNVYADLSGEDDENTPS